MPKELNVFILYILFKFYNDLITNNTISRINDLVNSDKELIKQINEEIERIEKE